MGPYYLTTLALLFGPATQVAALGRRSRDHRVIGAGPAGRHRRSAWRCPPTSRPWSGYAAGQAASLLLSFDSPLRRHGFVEITGTEATLALPDPNRFDGEVRLRASGQRRVDASSRPTGPPRAAGSACWTWPARCAAARRTGPPVSWRCTCWRRWRPSPAPSPAVRFEPVGTTFTVPEALAADWDPYARTVS